MLLSETDYPISEYATLFPDMDPGDYGSLVARIRDHCLLEPIAVWRGQVIDGDTACGPAFRPVWTPASSTWTKTLTRCNMFWP